MKKQLLFFFPLFLNSILMTAQIDWKCGTRQFRMLAEGIKENAIAESDTATLYIPVTFNLVGTDDGTGYNSIAKTLEGLCKLQTDMGKYGFHFYLENLKYFANSDFYDMSDTYVFSDTMLQYIEDHFTPNTLNVFIVEHTAGGWSFVTGPTADEVDVSIYPPVSQSAQRNSVVILKNHLNNLNHVFTHEVGHYLNLVHTFAVSDWSDFALNGTPDTVYSNYYDAVNDTTIYFYWLVERVDGVHCDISGDLICDTPPDYLSGGFTCNANGESNTIQTDPVGATFQSDGSFYMSYSNDACQSRFSDGQVEVMRAFAQGPRNYLLYNQTPPPPFPPADWTLVYPPDNDTVAVSDSITLQWDVPGADFYLLEFGRVVFNNTHAPILKNVLLADNSFNVSAIPGLRYYWKISPISKYYPCTILVDTSYFVAAAAVGATEAADAYPVLELYPNPVSNKVYWRLPEEEAVQDVNIQVFDAQGRLVLQRALPARQPLDVQGLTPGMYALKVMMGERVYAGRFVKQ